MSSASCCNNKGRCQGQRSIRFVRTSSIPALSHLSFTHLSKCQKIDCWQNIFRPDVKYYYIESPEYRPENKMSGGGDNEEAVEFTLEDAYEHLKELREELGQEMENLMHHSSNNETTTIPQGIGKDEIMNRYHKLVQGLLKSIQREEPKGLPIPNTIDLHKMMIQDGEEVIDQLQQLIQSTKTNINTAKKNIAYLESNKEGLEKMKAACLGAIESVGSATNQEEIVSSKRLFHVAKNDLFAVVDTIFPDELGFKDVLAAVTKAYSTGGDDVYIDVEPEALPFVKFLIEADVATYHRNDKSKIRMTDLL